MVHVQLTERGVPDVPPVRDVARVLSTHAFPPLRPGTLLRGMSFGHGLYLISTEFSGRTPIGTAIAAFVEIRPVMRSHALSNTPDSKILIIDDDQDVLSAMSFFLEMNGFPIRTTHNGLKGLDGMKANDRICLFLLNL